MKCNHVAGESVTPNHLKEAGVPGMLHMPEIFPETRLSLIWIYLSCSL